MPTKKEPAPNTIRIISVFLAIDSLTLNPSAVRIKITPAPTPPIVPASSLLLFKVAQDYQILERMWSEPLKLDTMG